MLVAPKDGHPGGFDLDTNALLYRQPVTRMDNEEAPFEVGKPVHFCPANAAADSRARLMEAGRCRRRSRERPAPAVPS
jgi:hypothetical protein